MKGKIRRLIGVLVILFVYFCVNISIAKADWADCYVKKEKDSSVGVGETFKFELGSDSTTYGTSIYGLHYELEFDPDVLEPILEKNIGVGSYYGWENVNTKIEESSISIYDTLIVDMKTNDFDKHVTSDSNGFLKLGYVNFKVKETNASNTKITLVQTWKEDLVNGQFVESTSSFKYAYDFEFEEEKFQEPCTTTITTYVNIYRKPYLLDIKLDDTSISNFDSEIYEYGIKSLKKDIKIDALAPEGYSISGDIGKKMLAYGDNKFKIEVTSTTGEKKDYIINVNYPDNRSKINTLKDLKLSSGEIEFDSSKTEYYLNVKYEVEEISIYSELSDNKSSYVNGFGDRKVALVEGKNEVLIKVKSEIGDINTYTLNITRVGRTDSCDIKSLNIKGYDIHFDTSITNYNLDILEGIMKLDISVELADIESQYTIIGNENLSDDSVIVIEVTDKNENNKKYYINIDFNEVVQEKDSNNNSIRNIIIVALIVLGILSGIVAFIIIYKKRR